MNWWLVTRHLKHGMMTVRKNSPGPHAGHDMASMGQGDQHSVHAGMSMSPGDGEHADHDMGHDMGHDMSHDMNHDTNHTPPLGTILAVGAFSVAILAGAVVFVASTLPAAG